MYGVFLGFGAFIFALMRAYAPKLALMSIFGTIAIDIYCVSTLFFPLSAIYVYYSYRVMVPYSPSHNTLSLTHS